MYHFLFSEEDDISYADDIIYADVYKGISSEEKEKYQFKHLEYPNIAIPNRSIAIPLSFLPEDSEVKRKLRADIEEFNDYIDILSNLDGFRDFFVEHNMNVSRQEIEGTWSKEITDQLFSKKDYIFSTNLEIYNDVLFDSRYTLTYLVHLDDTDLIIPIGSPSWEYTDKTKHYSAYWNFVDTGNDFTLAVWDILGSKDCKEGEEEDEEAISYPYWCYDQWRYDTIYPQMIKLFKKMQDMGYIHSYTVFPQKEDASWKEYGKSDGSIDLILVDPSFRKNKLLMEQCELIQWTPKEELEKKPYILTDKNKRQYLSAKPGALGGHRKLKIYGRLDCPSANRYVKKGQYVRNRVFFEDEDTAILAGFRPCGVCMPEAYKKWKEEHEGTETS